MAKEDVWEQLERAKALLELDTNEFIDSKPSFDTLSPEIQYELLRKRSKERSDEPLGEHGYPEFKFPWSK